jgi:osmotically-inducible protein OsmY
MTDRELQQNVQNALDWEPSIEASEIGVSVENGVVTLRGDVGTYAEKYAAERVALRVYGAKAVANDIAVRPTSAYERTDTEIAQAAVSALQWNAMVPKDKVSITVSKGWVTLTGTVDWQYQRNAAEGAVRNLTGVKGVINHVAIKPHVEAGDVKAKIEAAFRRSAEIDARRINVAASDGKVVLTGNVRSWAERREAEQAAWAAPGVMQVEDHITVVP